MSASDETQEARHHAGLNQLRWSGTLMIVTILLAAFGTGRWAALPAVAAFVLLAWGLRRTEDSQS